MSNNLTFTCASRQLITYRLEFTPNPVKYLHSQQHRRDNYRISLWTKVHLHFHLQLFSSSSFSSLMVCHHAANETSFKYPPTCSIRVVRDWYSLWDRIKEEKPGLTFRFPSHSHGIASFGSIDLPFLSLHGHFSVNVRPSPLPQFIHFDLRKQ